MDISPQSHELNPHHSATMGALVPALSLPKGASHLGTSEAWNLNRVSLGTADIPVLDHLAASDSVRAHLDGAFNSRRVLPETV